MSVAIITGASSGIGEAVAIALAQRGWKVGLIARREDRLQALKARIGEDAAIAAADVTDRAGLEAAIAQLQQTLGPCDLMLANAGIGETVSGTRFSTDAALKVIDVNVNGVIHAIGAVIPQMVERGSGHVAVVSSVAGYRGLPGFGAYSASKAAVTNFFEAQRGELIPRGIAVTSIHPGYVETPLTDTNNFSMPFIIPAEKAARIMANGLEKRKKEINYPWQMANLMRLARVLPNWAWDLAVSKANPAKK